MKKLTSMLLALALLLSLAACGQGQELSTEGTVSQHDTQTQPGNTQSGEVENAETESVQTLNFAESYEEVYETLKARRDDEALDLRYGAATDTATNEVTEDSSAGETGAGYSGTNVQVEGIDEGDIVKTDGEYIYVLRQGSELLILKAAGADTETVCRMELGYWSDSGTPPEDTKAYSYSHRTPREIFICGDTLAVIYEYWAWSEWFEDEEWNCESASCTELELWDVSDPANPEKRATLGQDGNIIDTRLLGTRLYIVSFWDDYSYDMRGEVNETEACIPGLYCDGNRSLIPAEDICICPYTSSAAYTVAAVYELKSAEILSSQTVLGGGSNVYMSGENIYVAGRVWSDGASEPRQEGVYSVTDYAPSSKTVIYRFDIKNGLELCAQGTVDGYIESQFSMDEHEGFLRFVTTCHSSSYTVYTDEEKGFVNYEWHDEIPDTNALYILDSGLNTVGCVEDLAPGEQVYSARFDGNIAYFCTFETVDPLFAVDCSDPASPVVLSALKISGFSEYLHFWDEGRLFGFGYEADEETGRTNGLKMVMFSTADKTDVTVESYLNLEDCSYSEALYDHHAIFISPEKNIIGFAGDGEYYIYGYSEAEGFCERGRFSFEDWDWEVRGMYIGDEIYIVGQNACYVLDMDSCGLIKSMSW